METIEICRLSAESVAKLLAERQPYLPDSDSKRRRKVVRWPFPGTVELWVPESNGEERYTLASSLDLSLHGVGIRTDEPLEVGMELAIAIHEPECTFHGRATVRHCTEIDEEYLLGLEFVFYPE